MIYCPFDWVADDWSLTTVTKDPDCETIAVPARFNDPTHWSYQSELSHLDLSRYKLVILSDIEFDFVDSIQLWINKNRIKRFVLALGGQTPTDLIDPARMMYRPWWCYNLLKYNQWQPANGGNRPYLFDVLLGARRPHRDFVMLSLQQHNLLDSSIATYRDIFSTGTVINNQTTEFAGLFPNHTLQYPYVSSNLNHNWEVQTVLEKSISRLVPWKIYQQTWYSIVAETLGTGSTFFLSEKTTKALFAQRLFVVFGNAGFLRGLHDLGFETFADVIDETYDSCQIDSVRFTKASEQLVYLSRQNPNLLYEKLRERLIHNHNRLFELRTQTKSKMQDILLQNFV